MNNELIVAWKKSIHFISVDYLFVNIKSILPVTLTWYAVTCLLRPSTLQYSTVYYYGTV